MLNNSLTDSDWIEVTGNGTFYARLKNGYVTLLFLATNYSVGNIIVPNGYEPKMNVPFTARFIVNDIDDTDFFYVTKSRIIVRPSDPNSSGKIYGSVSYPL